MRFNKVILAVPTLLFALLLLMVKDCSMETPPPFEEPVVYVTFTRWENRTFSPRLYYLLMQRYGLQNRLLGIPSYETISSGSGAGVKPEIDISNRFGFPSINQKGKPRRPGNTIKFGDRSSSAKPYTGSALETNDSAVVFPSIVSPTTPVQSDPARLAYPELSNRSPILTTFAEPEQPLIVDYSNQILSHSQSTDLLDEDVIIETNRLTFDIMRVTDWQDKNVVFSPFSIANCLALLLLGSGGMTHKEIATQLYRHSKTKFMSEEKEQNFHIAFSNLLKLLESTTSDHVSLQTYSRIFVDQEFSLLPSFEKNALLFYNANSEKFDFHTGGERFKKMINAWIAYKTKDKISTLLDNPPAPSTTLVLLNAVYFQGSWRTPFMKRITQMKPFYVSPTETMSVPMMTNVLIIPYLEEENFRVIGLPYKDNKTGLFIILPKNPGVKGLRELELQLNHESLNKLYTESMRPKEVTIQMPKMRVESDGHIQETLSKLGMKTIFDQKHANFSRLSNNSGLYINSIHHRAVLDINEKGTEAAAATVATGDRNLEDRPVLFAVNRPFIFCIVQVKAKTVLFWGRVTRPQILPE